MQLRYKVQGPGTRRRIPARGFQPFTKDEANGAEYMLILNWQWLKIIREYSWAKIYNQAEISDKAQSLPICLYSNSIES